jgi:acetylglutamate kinase
LLLDIHFMETVGMRPVVVHGGGARISAAMKASGIESRFVKGRRFTDRATLEIVERVLAVETNNYLAEKYGKIGGRAATLNFQSNPVLTGKLLDLKDESGEPVELGFVGEVTEVDDTTISRICDEGVTPFIPSMCSTIDGQKLNVNADTVATTVAQKLGADKLVFISDVPGVLRDPNEPTSSISSLTIADAEKLIADGTISGGMIPKIEACIETVRMGVKKVHIVDGSLRHGLLLEIYTSRGIGTVITEK